MVRTKAMAVLLGPAGFGIFGVYGSIATLTQTVAGMGVNSSGVRQIAEAAETGDAQRIASTTVVLRRLSLVLGLLGAALMIDLSRAIAVTTFRLENANEFVFGDILLGFLGVEDQRGNSAHCLQFTHADASHFCWRNISRLHPPDASDDIKCRFVS